VSEGPGIDTRHQWRNGTNWPSRACCALALMLCCPTALRSRGGATGERRKWVASVIPTGQSISPYIAVGGACRDGDWQASTRPDIPPSCQGPLAQETRLPRAGVGTPDVRSAGG